VNPGAHNWQAESLSYMIPAMFLKVKYGKHLVGDRGEEKKIYVTGKGAIAI
jgi:hypothetical protein